MKNMKSLLASALMLMSASIMATMGQPGVLASEDAPIRLGAGLKTKMHFAGGEKTPFAEGFGLNDMGLSLGYSHRISDFEYGLAVTPGVANQSGKLFAKDYKDGTGFAMDVELMSRYMPELAENFRMGLGLSLGWGKQFGKETSNFTKAAGISFGDMVLKVGVPLSYGITDAISLYTAPSYALSNIRMHKKEGKDIVKETQEYSKQNSNLSGMELPLGMAMDIGENGLGMWVEANTSVKDFRNFSKTIQEEVTLGVNFAL